MNILKKSILQIIFGALFIGQVQTAQAGWYDYVQSAASWAKSTVLSVTSSVRGQSQQFSDAVSQNRKATILTGVLGGLGIAAVGYTLWKRYNKQASSPPSFDPDAKEVSFASAALGEARSGDPQNPALPNIDSDAPAEPEALQPLNPSIGSSSGNDSDYEESSADESRSEKTDENPDFRIKGKEKLGPEQEAYQRMLEGLPRSLDAIQSMIADDNKLQTDRTINTALSRLQEEKDTLLARPEEEQDQKEANRLMAAFYENVATLQNKINKSGDSEDEQGPSGINYNQKQFSGSLLGDDSGYKSDADTQSDGLPPYVSAWQPVSEPKTDRSLTDSCELIESTKATIWPDESLFNLNLKQIKLINPEEIEKHLDKLYEQYKDTLATRAVNWFKSLFGDQEDEAKIKDLKDQFKKDAKFLIAFGGKCFYALSSGNSDALPRITVPNDIYHADAFDEQRRAQLQVITAIQWFFYSQGVSVGEPFEQGTFVLEDAPNGEQAYATLHDYMLNYVKMVNPGEWKSPTHKTSNYYGLCRASSHFKEQQKENKHKHYGIDVDLSTLGGQLFIGPNKGETRDSDVQFLPTGQIHLLFGRVDKTRIFCKPENYGLCSLKKDGFPGHAIDFIVSKGRKMGFGSDEAEGMRKERFPQSLINIIAGWKEYGLQLDREVHSVADLWQVLQERKDRFAYMKQDEKSLLATLRHVDKRFGNEVYFTLDDVIPAAYCYSMADMEQQKLVAEHITVLHDALKKFYAFRKNFTGEEKEGEEIDYYDEREKFYDLVHRLPLLEEVYLGYPKKIRHELLRKQLLFEKIAPSQRDSWDGISHEALFVLPVCRNDSEERPSQRTARPSLKQLAATVCNDSAEGPSQRIAIPSLTRLAAAVCVEKQIEVEDHTKMPDQYEALVVVAQLRNKSIAALQLV